MSPLAIGSGLEDIEGVNVLDVNSRHGLWSFGLDGGGGVVEFWDPRSRSALTKLLLPVSELIPAQSYETSSMIAQPQTRLSVTSLASHPTDGLSLAVGTSSGHTLLYDLRSPAAFAVKDQGYGESIKIVDWLRGGGAQEDTGRVVSADSKVIKIWGKDDVRISSTLRHPLRIAAIHQSPLSTSTFAASRSSCCSPLRFAVRGLQRRSPLIVLYP